MVLVDVGFELGHGSTIPGTPDLVVEVLRGAHLDDMGAARNHTRRKGTQARMQEHRVPVDEAIDVLGVEEEVAEKLEVTVGHVIGMHLHASGRQLLTFDDRLRHIQIIAGGAIHAQQIA